jgi:hypothetical protein
MGYNLKLMNCLFMEFSTNIFRSELTTKLKLLKMKPQLREEYCKVVSLLPKAVGLPKELKQGRDMILITLTFISV